MYNPSLSCQRHVAMISRRIFLVYALSMQRQKQERIQVLLIGEDNVLWTESSSPVLPKNNMYATYGTSILMTWKVFNTSNAGIGQLVILFNIRTRNDKNINFFVTGHVKYFTRSWSSCRALVCDHGSQKILCWTPCCFICVQENILRNISQFINMDYLLVFWRVNTYWNHVASGAARRRAPPVPGGAVASGAARRRAPPVPNICSALLPLY